MLVTNALAFSLPLALCCLSLHVSLRFLAFPDLGILGAYLCGAFTYGALVTLGVPWPLAALAGTLSGAGVGALTALLHFGLHVSSLLAGILSVFAARTVSARIALWANAAANPAQSPTPVADLANRTHLGTLLGLANDWSAGHSGLHRAGTPFVQAVFAVCCVVCAGALVGCFSRRRIGVAVRSVGDNRALCEELRLPVGSLGALGLAAAGSLAGAGGVSFLLMSPQATLDCANFVLIEAFAAYFLGFALVRVLARRRFDSTSGAQIAAAASIGAFLYQVIQNFLQVESAKAGFMNATDYGLVFAIIVAAASHLVWRVRRRPGQEDRPIKVY